ncbi:MAG: hypothetical protein ACI8Z9_000842 [Paraglaciecola sp.]|jgi:uncharacterized protein YheU (UPF0270 family)
MIIPIQELAQDTLFKLIEGFVLQEGTEYGAADVSLEEKVQQVYQQLQKDEAMLVYSELHETVNIVPKGS